MKRRPQSRQSRMKQVNQTQILLESNAECGSTRIRPESKFRYLKWKLFHWSKTMKKPIQKTKQAQPGPFQKGSKDIFIKGALADVELDIAIP